MTETRSDVALPTSSKVLCAVYALIALAALIATWSQNVAYLHDAAGFLANFITDTKVNPASRSITADILLFCLAAFVFMVVEARKHGIRFLWAYLIGSALIAVSVTFPLFMIAREVRIGRTDPTRLESRDVAVLAFLAVAVAAAVIWLLVL
jgi:hypothetical protein